MATSLAQTLAGQELADAKLRQARLAELLAELPRGRCGAEAKTAFARRTQLPKAEHGFRSVMPNKAGRLRAANSTRHWRPADGGGIHHRRLRRDRARPTKNTANCWPAWTASKRTSDKSRTAARRTAGFATGVNLEGMEVRGIDFHTPVESPAEPQPGNPALRADPRQPVAEAQWPQLPRNDKGKLAKCNFIYDAASDCCICPLGKGNALIARRRSMPARKASRQCGFTPRKDCEELPAGGGLPRSQSQARSDDQPRRSRADAAADAYAKMLDGSRPHDL